MSVLHLATKPPTQMDVELAWDDYCKHVEKIRHDSSLPTPEYMEEWERLRDRYRRLRAEQIGAGK